MSKVKVVLNSAGIQALLKSPEMQSVLNGHARRVQSRCGDGHEVIMNVHKKRAVARVRANKASSNRKNLKENTLLKALS